MKELQDGTSSAVEAVNPPAAPVSRDITHDEKVPSALEEKAEVKETGLVEVNEVAQPLSKSRVRSYLSSISSFFSVRTVLQCRAVLIKFAKFTGPGAIISVAYVDPDNFQTALSSGARFEFKLLCVILVSNLVAIYLQALSVKLGSVTGMDLAQMNRAYLPKWLNLVLYAIAEASIVCADVGQVIGTAIALNILCPQIPLVAGCALSAADTLFILLFYRPDGSLRGLRAFEVFVTVFVLGMFISFCIQLSFISSPVGDVFDGFLPSRDIFVGQGLFQSCAILGGTLMPHSIYLGSGLVQARMCAFDRSIDKYHEALASNSKYSITLYRPSLSAIKSCLSYSIAELCITLFIVAVFVNSAILIIAAATFTDDAANADLYGMYDLFVSTISQASGTLFAVGLLFSGIGAGIVATLAGQLVCEGALNWRMSPFLRRLLTRSLAVIPGIVVAAVGGREGLATALNRCNVVMSVALIFVTFPLVWYTSFHKYMRVRVDDGERPVGVIDGILDRDTERADEQNTEGTVSLANNWATTVIAFFIWFVIAGMNVALLVFLGLGLSGD
jgi:metal iron transporter